MLDQFFCRSYVRARLHAHRHYELFQKYTKYLHDRGYARLTIQNYLWAVEHFCSWLVSKHHSLSTVDQPLVRNFLDHHLPKCSCPRPSSVSITLLQPALKQLVNLLHDQRPKMAKSNRIDAILEDYRCYLCDMGGMSVATCKDRIHYVRGFLEARFGSGILRWTALRPHDIVKYVVGYAQSGRQGSVQTLASSLRSFLRFLQFKDMCIEPSLIAAIPSIPNWQLSRIPKTMTEKQLRDFLSAFDCSIAIGQRDYAMALCQVDLGLRGYEVAGLCLEDIDWRKAILRINATKVHRAREFPLPARLGQAISRYLHYGRPSTHYRNIFVRHQARHGLPVSTSVIRYAMHKAYAKVQGCEHWKGTHVLRHTAATMMLRHGASLKEIADMLGHQSIETTTIYAKVDLPALAAVALPWPEVQ